jgi:CelD/BcsL family acetyltransferase involved in cellulose biosynthesis
MYPARPVAAIVQCAVDDPRWLELVESDSAALPFHHPAWTRLLAESYGFTSFVLAQTDESGRLTAGLPVVEVGGGWRRPRRWISLPFTDTCPPLTGTVAPELLADEIEAARLAAEVESLEVRGAVDGRPSAGQPATVHVLRLDADPERVASRFKSSVRRNIRAAQNGPGSVRVATAQSDLSVRFYRLHVEVRRRLGLPVQPRRYFQLLWSRVIEPGLGRVLLVDVGGETVAGAVFLTWNRTVVYKYGASDSRYWSLRPNNLLFWAAIEWACGSGYELLDFGRTDHASTSLRRFKLGWATDEQPLEYTIFGTDRGPRREPPELARTAVRHSPRWVVRALGEIFYRSAA